MCCFMTFFGSLEGLGWWQSMTSSLSQLETSAAVARFSNSWKIQKYLNLKYHKHSVCISHKLSLSPPPPSANLMMICMPDCFLGLSSTTVSGCTVFVNVMSCYHNKRSCHCFSYFSTFIFESYVWKLKVTWSKLEFCRESSNFSKCWYCL